MAFKFVVLAALLAVSNAGFIGAPAAVATYAVHAPAVGASHQSTVRSLDGNHAISHYSKAVDSAYSSVRKTDTRISNDAVAYAAAPAYASYAAPAVAAYHAPAAVAAYAAPAAYHAPVVAKTGLLGVAYSAAPAVTHLSFDGYGVHYGY